MSEYEFSESQNVVIRDLARKMRVVGILFCLLGLLYLLGAAGLSAELCGGMGASLSALTNSSPALVPAPAI